MRRVLLLIACSFILVSCATHSFFISPNSVSKTKGTIYMDDGTVKKGIITISFENEQERDNRIIVKKDKDAIDENLDIKSVKSYNIEGHTYIPKIIDVHMSHELHYLFVERLTDEKAKMQLYKLLPSANTYFFDEEPYYYFISFPSFAKYQVLDINSSKLVPDFDIKMSRYVEDCPDLTTKIQLKNKDYYYTTFSLGSKRADVIKRIVKEYNDCK